MSRLRSCNGRACISFLATVSALAVLLIAPAGAHALTWLDWPGNPVLSVSHHAYYPSAAYRADRFGGHGTAAYYKCWYDDGGQTWLAYSDDMKTWTQFGASAVLTGRHPQVVYDPGHFGDDQGDLIQASFTPTYAVDPYYKMWYWDDVNSHILFAYSDDGENWHTNYTEDTVPHQRFPYNPGSPVYSVNVIYTGTPGSTNYRGWADNNGQLFNVSSADGTTWTVDSDALLVPGPGHWDGQSLSVCSVVRLPDGLWHMWFGGADGGGGNQGIGYATSPDGSTWTTDSANPMAALGGYGTYGGVGAPGTWNADRNYAMTVLYDPDHFSGHGGSATLKMLRSGVSGSAYTLGLALGDPTVTLVYVAGAHGSIVGSSTQTISYDASGTTVTATPASGYHFADWSDGVLTAARRDTSVTVDTSVTAAFAANPKSVIRLSGPDRYQTAIAVANDAYPGWGGVKNVVIASGQPGHEADALTGAGLAGAYDCPLLLVPTNYLPDSVRSAIGSLPRGVHVHLVGGPPAISSKVRTLIDGIPRVGTIDRTSGKNRYETGAAVARKMKSVLGSRFPKTALLTNGQNPSYMLDPLVAGTASVSKHFPVLLLTNSGVPSSTRSALSSLKLSTRYVVGGPAAVPNATLGKLSIPSGNRIAGADLPGDSTAFAERANALGWLTDSWVGFAAKVPDASTGGAYMGKKNGPLLLVLPSSVPAVTQTYLTTNKAAILGGYLFGGPPAVAETVRVDLEGLIN